MHVVDSLARHQSLHVYSGRLIALLRLHEHEGGQRLDLLGLGKLGRLRRLVCLLNIEAALNEQLLELLEDGSPLSTRQLLLLPLDLVPGRHHIGLFIR